MGQKAWIWVKTVAVAITALGVVGLIIWAGFLISDLHWDRGAHGFSPLGRQVASPPAKDASFYAPPKTPSPLDQPVSRCQGEAVAGSVLLLRCGADALRVVELAGVNTLPTSQLLGVSAADLMRSIVKGQLLDCSGQPSGGVVCVIDAPKGRRSTDLRLPLLESGLAAIDGDAPQDKLLADAQARARVARLGLWWDVHSRDDWDPVLWRASRDAGLGEADTAQATRALAFAGFFTAALTGLLGFAISELLKQHEKGKLQLEVDRAHEHDWDVIKDALRGALHGVRDYVNAADPQMRLEYKNAWEKFKSVVSEADDQFKIYQQRVRKGKVASVVPLIRKRKLGYYWMVLKNIENDVLKKHGGDVEKLDSTEYDAFLRDVSKVLKRGRPNNG